MSCLSCRAGRWTILVGIQSLFGARMADNMFFTYMLSRHQSNPSMTL